MKSGIYKLTNLINGKFYIGKSLDVESRKYSHYYTLRRNKHGNAYLQRAWNKYGEENFVFSIIELVGNNQLNIKELYYIDTLKPEYNIMKTLDKRLRMAQSSKDKLSKYQTNKHNSKPVFAKNILTQVITKYTCSSDVAKKLQLDAPSIRKVLKGKRTNVDNYTFSYDNTFPTNSLSKKIKKSVLVYDKSNNLLYTYKSQLKCSKDLKISYGFLHRLLKSGKLYKDIYYFRTTALS